ncbi:hypothetical protein DDE82_001336 [Stemphylium lycopersici]|nr:hypothetical protein TW65_06799 [Stemphylium lycopersici]RAR10062.1 hypothetical protein DDE82_001336 [Stemphylium lycopersici]
MTTNSVVVDRGHLRRLKRQVGRKEAMLLDTLGLTAGRGPEEEEAEDGEEPEEDSEDELAPTEPVKSDSARHGQDEEQARTSEDDAHPLPSDDAPAVTPHVATPIAPISHFNPLQAPNTPNPTAGLLPVVQFPQTPAGQQAQTTFYTTLTQGLGELVYKAMAQSGLLPLNCPTPFANVAPPPTTPLTTADKIAPATDPKWFFPPLSEEAQQHVTAQSSPPPVHPALPATGRTGRRLGTTLQHGHRGQAATVSSPLVKETPLVALHAPFAESSPIRPRRTSPRVEIQRRRIGPPTKYPFSKADDIYISRKKVVDGLSLTAIKESQAKWKDWPLGAFRRRWTLIKDQNLHIHKPSVALSEDKASGSGHEPDEQARTSPMQSHHLPTPSSSEHEDSRKEADAPMGEPSELPSSAHYDDDELELLSLAGADVEEDQQAFLDEERTPDAVPEDAVIPSIETPDMINEDQLQRDLLENLPMRSATLTPTQPTPVHIKTEPVPSSPLSTRKPIPLITSFETIPDSEDNLGDDIEGSVRTSYSLHCPVCKRPFKTAKTLARHQANPRGTHTHMATVAATAHSAPRRRSASSSIDLLNDQDTQDKNNNDDDDDDDDNDVLSGVYRAVYVQGG